MLKDLREKLSLMEISSMSFAIYRTNCRNFAYGVYAHEAYCSILYHARQQNKDIRTALA